MPSRTSSHDPGDRIECIITYSKGFICSGGSGMLHLFEKTENKYLYKKTRAVSVWVDPASHILAHTPTGADSPEPNNSIMNMTLSPSEENVICATGTQQLYNLTLSAADLQGQVGSRTLRTPTTPPQLLYPPPNYAPPLPHPPKYPLKYPYS